MNTETTAAILKNELHRLVVETDNAEVLSQVKSIFEALLLGEEDWWDALSEKEKTQVQKGLQQLDNGDRMTHESVRKEINHLLGKP